LRTHRLFFAALGLTTLLTTPALAQTQTWQVALSPDNIANGRKRIFSAVDAAGNVLLTGAARNIPGDAAQWLWMEKLDAAGNSLWYSEWVNPHGMISPRGVIIDGQGAAYVVASAASAVFRTTCCDANDGSFEDNVEEQLTLKFDGATGAVVWTRSFAKPTSSGVSPFDIMFDSLGRVVTSGTYSEPYLTTRAYRNVMTTAGVAVWSALETDAFYEGPCAAGSNGELVCVSSGAPFGDYNGNIKVYKYTKTGALTWSKNYDDQGVRNVAADVAIDGRGNVLITGYNHVPGGPSPILNMRLRGSSGALMWLTRQSLNLRVVNAGTSAPNEYQKLVPTTQGDFIVIAGDWYPTPTGSNIDTFVMRIDTTRGHTEWSARRSGGTPFGMDVDAAGNAVVLSVGPAAPLLRTYAAASGAVLAEIPLTTGRVSQTLSIDPVRGRIFVSGVTSNPDFSLTGHTAAIE